jgi:hypothetical protein
MDGEVDNRGVHEKYSYAAIHTLYEYYHSAPGTVEFLQTLEAKKYRRSKYM